MAVGSVATIAQNSALAGSGGFALAGEGGGTITPGLAGGPMPQSGTFSGTFLGFAAAEPAASGGTFNCNFTFTSAIAETVLQGEGTATGTCTSVPVEVDLATITCSIVYSRIGTVVIIVVTAGTVTVSGPTASSSNTVIAGTGVFLFAPTMGNGVTSLITRYGLVGAAGAIDT